MYLPTILKVVIAALVATSLMTLFSYAYSAVRKQQFRETELLNHLLARLHWIDPSAGVHHWAGWCIHYLIGLFFVAIYYWTGIVHDFSDYVIAGALAGMVGVAGWKVIFALHPSPPSIPFKEYYLQLIAAHMVFGIGAYLGITAI